MTLVRIAFIFMNDIAAFSSPCTDESAPVAGMQRARLDAVRNRLEG
jgi:hypothetical protein